MKANSLKKESNREQGRFLDLLEVWSCNYSWPPVGVAKENKTEIFEALSLEETPCFVLK